MALMGIASGFFVIGWSFPYIQKIPFSGRVKFIALSIIAANIVNWALNLAAVYLPAHFLYLLAGLPLAASLVLSRCISSAFSADGTIVLQKKYPLKPVLLLCLLVLILNLNGGIILTVVYPSYSGFETFASYFRFIPYLMTLLLFFLRPGAFGGKLHPLFLSAAFMGLCFVSFAILSNSMPGYLLTEIFNQAAFALLDIFVWTIFGNLARNTSRPLQIFAAGLASNVIAVFLGGLAGGFLLRSENHFTLTALFSATTIFVTLLILPYVNSFIERDFVLKLNRPMHSPDESGMDGDGNSAPNHGACNEKHTEGSIHSVDAVEKIVLPTGDALTAREREIVLLILEGASNQKIYERLFISSNTLKTHLKNIYKKLGVANKRELLAMALDLRNLELSDLRNSLTGKGNSRERKAE